MASTSQDAGLTGDPSSSLFGVCIIELTDAYLRLLTGIFTPLLGYILGQSPIS